MKKCITHKYISDTVLEIDMAPKVLIKVYQYMPRIIFLFFNIQKINMKSFYFDFIHTDFIFRNNFENGLQKELCYSSTNKLICQLINKNFNNFTVNYVFSVPFCTPNCPNLDSEFYLMTAIKCMMMS